MEKVVEISEFQDVFYLDKTLIMDNRPVVIFDDYKLDYPKINYDNLLSRMIDVFNQALKLSKLKNFNDFAIICYLNPNRKNSVNIKSVCQIVTILKSLFKNVIYECDFINYNKFFKLAFGIIQPLLDPSLRKRLKFKKIIDLRGRLINLKEC